MWRQPSGWRASALRSIGSDEQLVAGAQALGMSASFIRDMSIRLALGADGYRDFQNFIEPLAQAGTLTREAAERAVEQIAAAHGLSVQETKDLKLVAGVTTAAVIGAIGVKGGGKILWGSWKDYPKVSEGGQTYAQVGDRLYTEHAVNRMQPSGLGSPAGEKVPSRNVSPNLVDDVIRSGQPVHSIVAGVPRTVYWSGNVGVVTENSGRLVISILRRGSE